MIGIIVFVFIISQKSEPEKVTTPTPQQTSVKVKQVLTKPIIQPIPVESTNNTLDNETIDGKLSVNRLEQVTKINAVHSDAIATANEVEVEAEAEVEVKTAAVIIEEVTPIKDQIKALNLNLLKLSTQIGMDMDISVINIEANNIKNKLSYFEQRLGKTDSDEPEWNKTEQMLLNTKRKLKALEEKLKLEGDWGKIRLKLSPEEQYKKLNLKYQYGF